MPESFGTAAERRGAERRTSGVNFVAIITILSPVFRQRGNVEADYHSGSQSAQLSWETNGTGATVSVLYTSGTICAGDRVLEAGSVLAAGPQ